MLTLLTAILKIAIGLSWLLVFLYVYDGETVKVFVWAIVFVIFSSFYCVMPKSNDVNEYSTYTAVDTFGNTYENATNCSTVDNNLVCTVDGAKVKVVSYKKNEE